MGWRKKDANRKNIPSPSDLKKRNRPGPENGSENKKTKQKRADDAFALALAPELGLRKCGNCHVTIPVDTFPLPASTGIKTAFKTCTACLDKMKARDLASGTTSYIIIGRERQDSQSRSAVCYQGYSLGQRRMQ